MPNESDVRWRQQCVEVLREVTAGDDLGPPQDDGAAGTMRKFEMSGHLYPAGLIDRMIAAKLLGVDDERGVILAAAGPSFFYKHR